MIQGRMALHNSNLYGLTRFSGTGNYALLPESIGKQFKAFRDELNTMKGQRNKDRVIELLIKHGFHCDPKIPNEDRWILGDLTSNGVLLYFDGKSHRGVGRHIDVNTYIKGEQLPGKDTLSYSGD